MGIISAEDVSAQVQRFWNAYCSGSKHVLEEMYLSTAIVFGTFARRSESVQLTLARRLRKSGNLKSFMSAELGPIDVQVAGDTAIASYPYHFHLIKANSDGSRLDLDVPYSRGTQIFQLDQNGALRIVHEHFSAAEPGKKVLIPRDDPSATQPQPTPKAAEGRLPATANAPFRISDTGCFQAANFLEPDEVRAAVHNCWQAISSKSKERVEEFYFPTAILFAADARRSELARLAIARRAREFFGSASSMSADIGTIDVQMAGAAGAIASYTFRLRIVRQLANGKCHEQSIPFCRSTTVFRRDDAGAARILHEHQSAAEVGSTKEVPVREPAMAR
jgi:ketosteroid isomerase-like protein